MSLTLAYSRAASSPVETFGGDTLAVGTWLYSHVPASEPDCGVVVSIESGTGPQAYDVFGGMRALPRTRVMVRWNGGTSDPRVVEHISTDTLRKYSEYNGLTGYFGFLATVRPGIESREAFVKYRTEAPARRAEAVRLAAEESARLDCEVGPWFASLETVIAAHDPQVGRGYVPDTVETKVIRRCLALVGVKARVTVRRYSMASGLDLAPAKGNEWTDADGAAIASIFPLMAWPHRYYDRDTGEHRDGWRVDNSIHPRATEDRSDLQSDYHCPGGFRVAPAYLLAVSAILSDEVQKASR